ncbi:hypothetical protein [Amycolatopsis sp. CA-126428]|uniref:hypothetical protein n=1 Tax=Amycolatopsis sp. CA-126428 TaxID=2073158 RepID=UPI000CD17281|nr:hypothetical protein [Amycolatopsis sp. CA-126428]
MSHSRQRGAGPCPTFAAGRGSFSLGGALFWTTLGSVAGAVVVYLAGALLGHDRMRRLAGIVAIGLFVVRRVKARKGV